jgi:hypothetical protein
MGKVKAFRIALAAVLPLLCAAPFAAQTDDLPVPAPAKTIAQEDRSVLEPISKPEDRTKKAIELADNRLKRAEELLEKQDYKAALEHLGRFQGIVTHTLAFLKPLAKERVRKPFRNMEIALRAQVPRIEAIRRQTPQAYGVHVKAIGEYARNARAEALNAFFDDTVIKDNSSAPPEKKEGKP